MIPEGISERRRASSIIIFLRLRSKQQQLVEGSVVFKRRRDILSRLMGRTGLKHLQPKSREDEKRKRASRISPTKQANGTEGGIHKRERIHLTYIQTTDLIGKAIERGRERV